MTTYQAIANNLLPICGELLWIEIFSQYHFFATIVALGESCLVLAFAHTTTENFMPYWFLELKDKAKEMTMRLHKRGRRVLVHTQRTEVECAGLPQGCERQRR